MELYYRICAYVLFGLCGLSVGSFLNVVIYRVPRGMSLSRPGSHCPTCGYTLRWYDNIPILSYLMLGGKCRACRAHISFRYTLVEVATMGLSLLSALLFWRVAPLYAVTAALAVPVLICIFFIDLEHMLIFDRFQIALTLLGVLAMLLDPTTVFWEHLIGAAVGGGLFLAVYYGAILFLGREGLGFGDVKLMAAAGLLLGWQRLLFAVLVGSVVASLVLVSLRLVRRDEEGREYPFAPFLVVGILAALFFGAPIIEWYIGLFSV